MKQAFKDVKTESVHVSTQILKHKNVNQVDYMRNKVVNRFESVKLAFRLINNAKVSIGVNSAEMANRW